MKYLIKLNKFTINKDKLLKKLGNPKIIEDNGELLLEGKIEHLQEIKNIYELNTNWKKLNFKELKEDCLSLTRKHNLKDYQIKSKFLTKIKISAKSVYKHINPYLKHENILFTEDSENIIYIEFKKDNEIYYRTFYSKINKNSIDLKYPFTIILENPSLSSEISDFLRICYIFKLPLIILTKNNINNILEKAKKETKGIDYKNFNLMITDKYPNLTLVGFTKHAKNNEKDLTDILNKNNLALVFGDDKFGLTQESRDKLDYSFRLTPETKKPLRASHALSYVLGIYTSKML